MKFKKGGTAAIVFVAAVAIAAALIVLRPRPDVRASEPVPPLVRVMAVAPGSHTFEIESQGTVLARTEITLAAEVSGRVESITPSLEAGGFFKTGDVLLSIDRRDYEAALAQSRAQVEAAKLRLLTVEADAEVARAEWQRMGSGTASPLTLREPQVAEAEAALAAAEALRDQARRNVARTRVTAPFDGRARVRSVDVGQLVAAGSPIAVIYAVDYAEVRLPLEDAELALVDVPMRYRDGAVNGTQPYVELHADYAGGEHVWPGRLVRSEGTIDPQTRLIYAVARVDDPYGRDPDAPDRPPLPVGLFVNARITGRTMENVFVIPREAIRGRNQVLVVDDEERLHIRELNILRRERDRVVVDRGLTAGELLCLSLLDAPVDGMRVRTIDAEGLDAAPESGGAR